MLSHEETRKIDAALQAMLTLAADSLVCKPEAYIVFKHHAINLAQAVVAYATDMHLQITERETIIEQLAVRPSFPIQLKVSTETAGNHEIN